ncbi:MAG: hypothetical protein JWQ02_4207, partial [Capsulimonas sp.]|nr:hypothetical protein [Capsulimonas sp.]
MNATIQAPSQQYDAAAIMGA